jgi:hypothetical protein
MAYISPYHQVYGPEFQYSMPNLELAKEAFSFKQKRFAENYKAFSDLKNTAFDIPLLHPEAKAKLQGYEQQINDMVSKTGNFSDPATIKTLASNLTNITSDEDIRSDYTKYNEYQSRTKEIEDSRKDGKYNPYSQGIINLELNDYMNSSLKDKKGMKFSTYTPHVDMDKDIIDPCSKQVRESITDVETIGQTKDGLSPVNTRVATKGKNYDELNGCIKNSLLNNTQARAYLESIEKYKYLSNPDPTKKLNIIQSHDSNIEDNVKYYNNLKLQLEAQKQNYLKTGQTTQANELDIQINRANLAINQLSENKYGTFNNGVWQPTDKVNKLLQSQKLDDELLNMSYNTSYDLYAKNYASALDGKDQIIQYKKNLLWEAEQEVKQSSIDNAFKQAEINIKAQEAATSASKTKGKSGGNGEEVDPTGLGPQVPTANKSDVTSIVDLRDNANNQLAALRPEADKIYQKPENLRTGIEREVIRNYENLNKIRDAYQKKYDDIWNQSLAKSLEADLNKFSVANRKESLDFGRGEGFTKLMQLFGNGTNFNLNDPIFKGSTGEVKDGIKIDVEEFKRKYFSDADFKQKIDEMYWQKSVKQGRSQADPEEIRTSNTYNYTVEPPFNSTLNNKVKEMVEANRITTMPFSNTTVIAMEEGDTDTKAAKADFINSKLLEITTKHPDLSLTSDMFSQVTYNPVTGELTGTLKTEVSANAKNKLRELRVEDNTIGGIENNKITLKLLPEKAMDLHFYQLVNSNSMDASNAFKTKQGIEYYAVPSPVSSLKSKGQVNFFFRLPGDTDFRPYTENGVPIEVNSSNSLNEIEKRLDKLYAISGSQQ